MKWAKHQQWTIRFCFSLLKRSWKKKKRQMKDYLSTQKEKQCKDLDAFFFSFSTFEKILKIARQNKKPFPCNKKKRLSVKTFCLLSFKLEVTNKLSLCVVWVNWAKTSTMWTKWSYPFCFTFQGFSVLYETSNFWFVVSL